MHSYLILYNKRIYGKSEFKRIIFGFSFQFFLQVGAFLKQDRKYCVRLIFFSSIEMKITTKTRKQFKSCDKKFQVDPTIISKVNKIIKDESRLIQKKYAQHKEAQRTILEALNQVRLEYLNKHQIILTAAEKVIQAIQKIQDQLHDQLDSNKEAQLDQINPEIQKFMKQKKQLKKSIEKQQLFDTHSFIDGKEIVKKINFIKLQSNGFNHKIVKFTELMTKILKNVTEQKENKTNIKNNKLQDKNIQTQPSQQREYLNKQTSIKEALISQTDSPTNKNGKNQNKTDKLLQKHYSYQLILDNFDIKKENKFSSHEPNNQQSSIFKKIDKEFFYKCDDQNADQSSIFMNQINTLPNNLRELQSVRSEHSFVTNNTRRSGSSRPVNCLEVLRKQKLKYDEIKNNLGK